MLSMINQLLASTVQQALPSAPAVKQIILAMKKALFWTVLCAMLASALIALLAYGAYLLLLMQGVLPLTAIVIVGLFLTLFMVIAGLLSRRQAEEIGNVCLFPEVQSETDETLQVLVKAFVEGLTAESKASENRVPEDASAPDATVNPVRCDTQENPVQPENVRKINGAFM
ncbi:MAG: hypothetical protein JJ879_09870 [Sneathiella sp.]|nr:hypothetical protein [Sneathiella sp.]